MGYDVWASDDWQIEPEKAGPAIKALLKACAEKDGYPNIEKWLETEEPIPNPLECPIDYLESRFETGSIYVAAEDGGLSEGFVMWFGDDSIRHEEYDRWLFEAVAPFVGPEHTIWFKGEDGYEWAWEAKDGKLVEVQSETVWGEDTQAPAVIQKIVETLYPDGKSVVTQSLPAYEWEQLVTKIETIVRENGFGPQAGMSELERMADV